MDDTQFDRLTRALGNPSSRRTAVRATAVTALAAFGLGAAEAKKKKNKCKKPKVKCGKKCCAGGLVCKSGRCALPSCEFNQTGDLWTLKANCGTEQPISLPDGVTLDGSNKTISLLGESDNYSALGGILAANGGTANVRNLGITRPASEPCGIFILHAIRFEGTSGQIENVTIKHLAQDQDGSCGFGIRVVGAAATAVDIVGADITGGEAGIVYEGGSGTISDSTVRPARSAISASADAAVNVTNNTLIGPGQVALRTVGVSYSGGAAGTVENNTISNFFDTLSGEAEIACGVRISATAGDVTIGTNTYPNPPGNEQNVCDNRP